LAGIASQLAKEEEVTGDKGTPFIPVPTLQGGLGRQKSLKKTIRVIN
jgi:hypothetical protein